MPHKDPQKRKEYAHQYYQKNKERFRLYSLLWRKNNPKKANAIAKKYRDTHKKERYITCTRWRKNNPEKAREIQRRRDRKIRKTLKGNLDHRMEALVRNGLKNGKGGRKWEDLVGYTVEELKEHLEKQFEEWMTWDKFLKGEIVIDHIKPKSAFKYTSPDDPEFKKCWALENLQPLEKIANFKKGNTFEVEPSYI